jgi:hypothetical protein
MPSDNHVSQFGLNVLWPVQAAGQWLFTAGVAVLSEICPCGIRVGKSEMARVISLYFLIPLSDIPPALQIHHHHGLHRHDHLSATDTL